jgi:hypothetical protein
MDIFSKQSAIRNPQSAIRNPQSAIQQSAIRNPHPLVSTTRANSWTTPTAFSSAYAQSDDSFEQ